MDVIKVYDYLHAIPELGTQEFKTAAYLADEIEKLGFKVQRNVGSTGIIATYDTGVSGPVVGIRADMDALAHLIDGKKVAIHSCGHDAHSAMALVAAEKLIKLVKKGTLKIFFQPAEEILIGALSMLKDGAMNGVDYLFAQHIRPIQELETGKISPAMFYSASVVLDVTIKGKTAHGARPHLGNNTIDAAAAAIFAVNSIRTNPVIPSSIKVTGINAGGAASNSIPDKLTMILDVRSQTNEGMRYNLEKIEQAITSAASANGCIAEVVKRGGVPAAELDEGLIQEMSEVIKGIVGEKGLAPRIYSPGGEDFFYYVEQHPNLKAAFFGLGSSAVPGLHDPKMSFDKEALHTGVELLVRAVMTKLG